MKTIIRVFCASVLLTVVGEVAAAQNDKEVSKSGAFNLDGRVSIDTYKGSITVTTWDKPEIEIHARVESDDYGRYAEEKVRDTEIRIDVSKSAVRIKSDYTRVEKRSGGFWGIFDGETGSLPFVYYTIKMPRTAHLVIKDYKSRTKVSDLRSDLEIETYKGSVDVVNLEGSLILETYKGDVRAEFVSMTRRSRFQTYKGDIEVVVPRQLGFDLDLDIGRKGTWGSDFDISVQYRRGRRSDLEYQGTINGGGPRLQLKTTKGNVRLAYR